MTGIFIALSVVCSTLLFVLFKFFARFDVDTPKALVINYFVAALFGLFFLPEPTEFLTLYNKDWIWMAALLGFLFISLFYLMAIISQRIGVAVASVATKMSVIIPVTAAVILYNDTMGVNKIAGILLALVGIWMATTRNKTSASKKDLWWLPVILFIGAGMLDTLLKLAESAFVPREDELLFIPSIFIMAAITGLIALLLLPKKEKTASKNINTLVGGVLLGVINYGSILFIWSALALDGVESSMVFPVANMGVVALSAVLGWLVFKESLTLKNWAGIGISILAIALITLI